MLISWILILDFGLILFGVPMALSMIATSAVYFLIIEPDFVALLPEKIFEGLDNIVLTAIPFFLLAGELMNRSGMTERLILFSNLVVGRIRKLLPFIAVKFVLLVIIGMVPELTTAIPRAFGF